MVRFDTFAPLTENDTALGMKIGDEDLACL